MKSLAEKNKYRFKGHESFILREGWLNKGLQAVALDGKVFSENYGADTLGVGPNMAKSIRYWLKTAGLTQDVKGTGTELTKLGQAILEKDPYIEQNFTLWLIHCRIVMNRENATAWNLFFNEFNYEEFSKYEMTREMQELAFKVSDGGRISERSVDDDCDAILHMYLKKTVKNNNPEEKNVSPFGKLGLLKMSGESIVKQQPDLKNLPDEIVLYLIISVLQGKKSIHIDELLTIQNGPGKILNLKRTALMEKLEALHAKEYITLNRTAGLNMVYYDSEKGPLEWVQDYYKQLGENK